MQLMYGINKKATWTKIEDNGFDDPVRVLEKEILVRPQKNRLTTSSQSNAYEVGRSTTYFTTMDFNDYSKDDIITYRDDKYRITEINNQPNIFGDNDLYIILKGEINA